jgi:hypothetical protein
MTGLALGDRLGYACHYLDDDAIKILLDSLHAVGSRTDLNVHARQCSVNRIGSGCAW